MIKSFYMLSIPRGKIISKNQPDKIYLRIKSEKVEIGETQCSVVWKARGRFIFGACCQNSNWKYWTQYFSKQLSEHFTLSHFLPPKQKIIPFFRRKRKSAPSLPLPLSLTHCQHRHNRLPLYRPKPKDICVAWYHIDPTQNIITNNVINDNALISICTMHNAQCTKYNYQ